MMTLRTLKKKSQQAREILNAHYGYKPERFFLATRCENYHGFRIHCACPQKPGMDRGCDCQWHPLPGTPMTGEVSGYYEPEWDERTALEDLQKHVMWDKRPDSMNAADWQGTLAITGVTPITEADIAAMLADDEAAEP